MKANDLKIEIEARLTVSDETARCCIKLLDIWQKNNYPVKLLRIVHTNYDIYDLDIVPNDMLKREDVTHDTGRDPEIG